MKKRSSPEIRSKQARLLKKIQGASQSSTSATKCPRRTLSNISELKERLQGSKFRWLNELLYTKDSNEAYKLFSEDRSLFEIYHSGFRKQAENWPHNPLNEYIKYVLSLEDNSIVADMGCGEARLAMEVSSRNLNIKVHSFDLVSSNNYTTECDISNVVPLPCNSVNVAIFCLSLMGKNYCAFLSEAHRILVKGGKLLIAEVTSRFTSITAFIKQIERLGFKFDKKDSYGKMFMMFEFTKDSEVSNPIGGEVILKPCMYKKR